MLGVQEINPPPQVMGSLNFLSEPDFIYSFIIHSISTSGFKTSLSYAMEEADAYMSVFLNLDGSELVSGTSIAAGGNSIQWFEEVGDNYLQLRDSVFVSQDPAMKLWEELDDNRLTPVSPGFGRTYQELQFFVNSGDYVIPSDDSSIIQTGDLHNIPTGTVLSVQWFNESGSNYLQVRDDQFVSQDPAVEMWENDGGLTPLNSPLEVDQNTQYFTNSGNYVIPSEDESVLNTGYSV